MKILEIAHNYLTSSTNSPPSCLAPVSLILLTVINCTKLEVTNPADPKYTLAPPSLLSAEPLTDTSTLIRWQNNDDFTKEFVINRKIRSGLFNTIGTINGELLIFTDTLCSLGTPYTYTVQSKVESNLSKISNILSTATEFPPPSDLIAIIVSDSQIVCRQSNSDKIA